MASKEDETSGGSEKERLSHERPGGSRMPDDKDGTVELIRRYIAEKLGFYSEESTDKSEKPKVDAIISSATAFLDHLIRYGDERELPVPGVMETIRDLLSERLSEHLPVERDKIRCPMFNASTKRHLVTEMIPSPVSVDVELLSSRGGYTIGGFAAECHSTPVTSIAVKRPAEQNPQSRRGGTERRYTHGIHSDGDSIDECQLARYTAPLFTAGREVVVTDPLKADVLNKRLGNRRLVREPFWALDDALWSRDDIDVQAVQTVMKKVFM